jgi:hypothetical protein
MRPRFRGTAAVLTAALGLALGLMGAPAPAAEGAGNRVHIEFGAINDSGNLTWSGTVSCLGTSDVDLVIHATEGSGPLPTTGDSGQDIACPTTGHAVSGELAPSLLHTWSGTGIVNWTAKLTGGLLGLHTVIAQTGSKNMSTGQNDSVSLVGEIPVVKDGVTTGGGVYECTGTRIVTATITLTVTKRSAHGTASITEPCPTTGPTPFSIIVPLIVPVAADIRPRQDCAPSTDTYNTDGQAADGTTVASDSHTLENTC